MKFHNPTYSMISKFQEKKKDRMYKCTECARSFDYEKNLERHMAKHKEGTLKEGDDQQVISRDFSNSILFTKFVYSLYYFWSREISRDP